MDVYSRVYEQLDMLPQEERIQLLREILPPQELFARTDGTRFIIRSHGLRIFETSAMLSQAGIPDDDPRADVFRELRGGLVDRAIPDKLRSISAKSETVCKNFGAIQVWEGGRKAWWVPLVVTSEFEAGVNKLIRKFEDERDHLLLNNYYQVRSEAEERWIESAKAAWENIISLGGTTIPKDDFLRRSIVTFNDVFPSQEDIVKKIKLRLIPVQKPLPQKIEAILEDVRQAERERLQSEVEANREQMRLVEIERQLKETEISKMEDERQLRARLLKESLHPEIENAKEIIVQAQASLMRVAGEIFRAIDSNAEISPATTRSWNRRLKLLSVFAVGNVPLEQALEKLQQLKNETNRVNKLSQDHVDHVSMDVERAFQELERRASLEIHADKIWQLLRSGKGTEALHRIASLRDEVSHNLNEVEALWNMVVNISAENEIEESDTQTEELVLAEEVAYG